MGAQLTATQLRRVLNAAGELSEMRELSEFPAHTARMMRELIPCEHAGYNQIDLTSGRATVVAEPSDVVFDGGPEILAQFGHQSPIITRARSGDRSVLRLSDHITRSDLHDTELYNYVYRVISLEYQLGLQLPAIPSRFGRPGEVVGVSLARHRRDFSAADRLMLESLGPHLSVTLERLHERALLQALLANGGDGRCTVLLDPRDDAVAWCTEPAARYLDLAAGDRLPPELRTWVGAARRSAAGEGQVRLGDRRLTVRLVVDAYPGLDALHLVAHGRADPQRLRALGLTPRQAEIQALALHGLSAQQIADALCVSRRTVEKHFQAIYDRLGVHNRAEAVAATMAVSVSDAV